MASDKYKQALPELRRRLRLSRSRARQQALFKALAWSGLVACAFYLSFYLAELIWRELPWTVSGWTGLLFSLTLVLTTSLAWFKTPSLLELARRADQQFGLDERASTALELSTAPRRAANAELTAALLTEAETLSSRIAPRDLIPFKLPRPAWGVLVLLSLIAVLQFGLPTTLQTEAVPSENALSEDARTETVSELRQTAELLLEEADLQQDPYLQALAQAFSELGETIEAGSLSEMDMQLELGQLMEHLRRAYGGAAPDAGPAEAERASQSSPPENEAQANSPSPSKQTSNADLSDLLEQLTQVGDGLQAAKDEREADKGMVSFHDLANFNPYLTPESLEALKRFEERKEQEAVRAGIPIGAAQESEAGAGDFAGEGTQDIAQAGGADAFTGLEPETDEVLLPEADNGTGEQIRLELSPETQFTEVTDDGSAETPSWQPSKESEMRHDLLLPRDRLVVSRYFARPETQEER